MYTPYLSILDSKSQSGLSEGVRISQTSPSGATIWRSSTIGAQHPFHFALDLLCFVQASSLSPNSLPCQWQVSGKYCSFFSLPDCLGSMEAYASNRVLCTPRQRPL